MKSVVGFLAVLIAATGMYAQTPGKLEVSVSTSKTGGHYAPRNVLAIWIEDNSGQFVKTLLAYGNKRRTHLNTWQAATNKADNEYNTTDAITGATKSSHDTRNCSWDGTGISGNLVEDGEYTIWFELTDKNETGNFTSFTFTKGENTQEQTPNDVPSFSSISINWQPKSSTEVTPINSNSTFVVFPNPGNGYYTVKGRYPSNIEVVNILGKTVLVSTNGNIDITNEPNGVYLFYFSVGKEKIIKNVIKE